VDEIGWLMTGVVVGGAATLCAWAWAADRFRAGVARAWALGVGLEQLAPGDDVHPCPPQVSRARSMPAFRGTVDGTTLVVVPTTTSTRWGSIWVIAAKVPGSAAVCAWSRLYTMLWSQLGGKVKSWERVHTGDAEFDRLFDVDRPKGTDLHVALAPSLRAELQRDAARLFSWQVRPDGIALVWVIDQGLFGTRRALDTGLALWRAAVKAGSPAPLAD